MASANRIIELSSLIAQQTTIINDFFEQRGLPTPSLGPNAPHLLPIPDEASDVKAARLQVVEACSELKALITGPRELLRFTYVSVKAILRFTLDWSFAVGEATSFEAMSEFSGLKVKNVQRIVRHAIINHRFFQEDIPGIITHSALTSVLSRGEMTRNALVVELDEFWPAGVRMAGAMEKWPNSEGNNETISSAARRFALANKGLFDIFADNQEKATMIDVGGSHGSVAINIAETIPNMKCIVQNLPDIVIEGASYLPKHIQGRTVTADVYYIRSIFHNWADKYCIKILQKLVPALRPGARIAIHECILPGLEKLTMQDATRAISLDVGMQQLLNAQQREMHEWPELFHRVGPKFRYLGAHKREGAIRWIMEAEWQCSHQGTEGPLDG
ncbi:S-adenosyl-L-methionine-dependent methyltransferase [Xylaria sp. FL0933]|nr:S-adenosyl-L-methionine-dependent methyltransferase [Xylaria sp. FL0933]